MFTTEARSDLQNALFDYLHVLTCIFCVINLFFFLFFSVFINIYLSSFVYTPYLNIVTWHVKKVTALVSWDYIYSLRNYGFLSFQPGTTRNSGKTEFSSFPLCLITFPAGGCHAMRLLDIAGVLAKFYLTSSKQTCYAICLTAKTTRHVLGWYSVCLVDFFIGLLDVRI